jgi:polyhydroxyalkanoate synthesis regulator phasin
VVDNAYPRGTEGMSGGQSIRDLIERTFLIGVGAAAFTKDRVQELVEEFVKRGELSSDEGREMVDRLVARSRDEARTAMRRADSSFQGALRDFGLTTRREFDDLDLRVRQLEHRVALLERIPGGADPDPASGLNGGDS